MPWNGSKLLDRSPYYRTHAGAAYLGDSLAVMRELPDTSVNLVMTSPQGHFITATPAVATRWTAAAGRPA